MRTNDEYRFPYFLVGMSLGVIAGLLLAPRSGEETRKYLREQSNKSLDYVDQQAGKLRQSTGRILEKGKQFVRGHGDSVETTTEAEKQVYQEERRETLGG
jgi:gas vesicle protein